MKSSNQHFQILILFIFLVKISEAGCLKDSWCTTTFPTSSVNLSQLCNNGNGYQFVNTTTGQTYKFEICGSIDAKVQSTTNCGGPNMDPSNYPCTVQGAQTNTYCNAEYNSYPFEGSFMTFFDPNPATQCVRGGCPNTGSFTEELAILGQNYCCTGQCEIIDVARPIEVENLTGPLSGIQWSSSMGLPPNNGDEFQCPIDPYTGNPRSRSVTYIMYCNANGTINDPLQTLSAYDNGSCHYTLVMRHFIACGTSFPSPSPSPSISNNDANTTCAQLITSISFASFFGIIVFVGIAIYLWKRVRTFGEDDSRNEPLLNEDFSEPTLSDDSLPKLSQVQTASGIRGSGVGREEGGVLYQVAGLTDEQIYIRRLPKKFKEYLEKQGAVDPSTGSVLKQIPIKEDQLMKFRALGVSNVILTELESTYKVISFSEA
jgi:hypothetical protein